MSEKRDENFKMEYIYKLYTDTEGLRQKSIRVDAKRGKKFSDNEGYTLLSFLHVRVTEHSHLPTHTHAHVHTCTDVHTYIHTYIHTYKYVCVCVVSYIRVEECI